MNIWISNLCTYVNICLLLYSPVAVRLTSCSCDIKSLDFIISGNMFFLKDGNAHPFQGSIDFEEHFRPMPGRE